MAIAITLIILFLIFFLTRRNSGSSRLAVIAGVSVYELFGASFASQIQIWIPAWDLALISKVIYVLLILVFPLALYFRSSHGGLHGILRILDSAVFAILLTALLAPTIQGFFPTNQLSSDILTWIDSVIGYILVIAILSAYLNILLYRSDS